MECTTTPHRASQPQSTGRRQSTEQCAAGPTRGSRPMPSPSAPSRLSPGVGPQKRKADIWATEPSRSTISAMIQNRFSPALHHARLAGSSTSRLRPALLRSVETSSPVSAPRHSKPCRAIPASVAAMKRRSPFKASVAGGKVAGLGVMEAHLRQETSWPNQALQPTCNPSLRSGPHAAELGRWASKAKS